MKVDLRECTLEQVKALVVEVGEKPFRAKQIYPFLFRGIGSLSEIGNIPKKLIEKMEAISYISTVEVHQVLTSKLDGTKKYLFRLADGNIIEGVLMEYRHGYSACISSQVGCRMGCSFCASTLDGLVRNVTAGEMIGQILAMQKDSGQRISNIVLMGSGEPFDNFDHLKKFLTVVHEEEGLNIGYRHITVSTCGIVPRIDELAEMGIPINLAISLHEINSQKRALLMPVENAYDSVSLLEAARRYAQKTGRRVTFEYALIRGINDDEQTAKKLANLLRGMLCHVNLIPLNPVEEKSYRATDSRKTESFCTILKEKGVQATVRREMGRDINGACGQLRRRVVSSESTDE